MSPANAPSSPLFGPTVAAFNLLAQGSRTVPIGSVSGGMRFDKVQYNYDLAARSVNVIALWCSAPLTRLGAAVNQPRG
jgi:hypothetical protein